MLRHAAILASAILSLTATSHAQYYYPDQPTYYRVEPRVYYPPSIIIRPPAIVPDQPYIPAQPYYPQVAPEYDDPPVVQRQYRSAQSSNLSYKCAQASEFIRRNECGPQGCDVAVCIARQHGCRIHSWGHTCPLDEK